MQELIIVFIPIYNENERIEKSQIIFDITITITLIQSDTLKKAELKFT